MGLQTGGARGVNGLRNLSEIAAIPDSGLLHSHWDATQLSGFDDGDSVSSLPDLEGPNDLSGNGVYRDSGIGGQPSIEMDGSDDGYSLSNWDADIPYGGVSFSVFEFSDTDAAMQLHSADDQTNGITWFFVSEPSDDQYRIYAADPQASLSGGSPDTSPHYGVVVWADDSSQEMRLDGGQLASGSGGDRQLLSGSEFSVGMDIDGSSPLEGYWAESGVYEPGVSITDLEAYLADKYSI